jgi:hypothetical protein
MLWYIRASGGVIRYVILNMFMDVDCTQGITYSFTTIEGSV